MPSDSETRIALIHALAESVSPAREAFVTEWPEAFCFDVLDTSLAIDLADAGRLDGSMMMRFQSLSDYAAGSGGKAGRTQAILFTCSAFGPAIDAVKANSSIPVLRPNESAFEAALELGDEIGLLATFGPSVDTLEAELRSMAAARGREVSVKPIFAEGALAALKAGDGDARDRLAAGSCRALGSIDALILGQFSLTRAASHIRTVTSAPVLTTPNCAARALRARVGRPTPASPNA